MSEAVKLFKAKVKELAAFVESNEADSYLSAEFLGRLTELRELTEIIKIDLANARKPAVPVFAPNSVYVPVEPGENLASAPVVEEVVETKIVEETVVEKIDAEQVTPEGQTNEVAGTASTKAGKTKASKT